MTERHEVLHVDSIEYDTDNPRIKKALELVSSGYLDTVTARKLIMDKILEAAGWSEKRSTLAGSEALTAALNGVADKLNDMKTHVETRKIPGVGMAEEHVYREAFGVLTEILDRPELARHTIEAIVDRMKERRGRAVRPVLSKAR